jgi:hypothetical protein
MDGFGKNGFECWNALLQTDLSPKFKFIGKLQKILNKNVCYPGDIILLDFM